LAVETVQFLQVFHVPVTDGTVLVAGEAKVDPGMKKLALADTRRQSAQESR
jgi:hypothetical protein